MREKTTKSEAHLKTTLLTLQSATKCSGNWTLDCALVWVRRLQAFPCSGGPNLNLEKKRFTGNWELKRENHDNITQRPHNVWWPTDLWSSTEDWISTTQVWRFLWTWRDRGCIEAAFITQWLLFFYAMGTKDSSCLYTRIYIKILPMHLYRLATETWLQSM